MGATERILKKCRLLCDRPYICLNQQRNSLFFIIMGLVSMKTSCLQKSMSFPYERSNINRKDTAPEVFSV